MNIWIISLFEPTPMDNTRPMRYMSIANEGVKRGHQIDHFSCTFRHSTKVQRFEQNHKEVINESYSVHYIYGPEYEKNLSINRIRSHRTFTKNLMQYVDSLQEPDIVLSAFPPFSTPNKISIWCKKRSIPFVVDVIDPWPDVFYQAVPEYLNGMAKLFTKPFQINVKETFSNANGITAISNEYVNWALEYTNGDEVKTEYFYPSVPLKNIQDKLKTFDNSSKDVLSLIYAGSFGVNYNIPIILEVARMFEDKYPGETEFIFCGAGHYDNLIKKNAKELNNVIFLGRLDYDDLLKAYKKSDLGLAQYKIGATQTVTYKLFDYLAAGLPVLNSLPTEMATIIKEGNVGKNNVADDTSELFKNIECYFKNKEELSEQKKRAVKLTKDIGDNQHVYQKFIKYLESFF